MSKNRKAAVSAAVQIEVLNRLEGYTMMKMTLELYTRPTCSDCQDAKAFLAKHNIPYTNYDLSKQPSKEADLIRITGTKMVPTFVFRVQSIFGSLRKPKVLIGFEQNIKEIKKLTIA